MRGLFEEEAGQGCGKDWWKEEKVLKGSKRLYMKPYSHSNGNHSKTYFKKTALVEVDW